VEAFDKSKLQPVSPVEKTSALVDEMRRKHELESFDKSRLAHVERLLRNFGVYQYFIRGIQHTSRQAQLLLMNPLPRRSRFLSVP